MFCLLDVLQMTKLLIKTREMARWVRTNQKKDDSLVYSKVEYYCKSSIFVLESYSKNPYIAYFLILLYDRVEDIIYLQKHINNFLHEIYSMYMYQNI